MTMGQPSTAFDAQRDARVDEQRIGLIRKLRAYRSRLLISGGVVASLLVLSHFFIAPLYFVETDDAYVGADTITVTPKVSSYVSRLYIDDNSKLKAGELVAELEPREFRAAVEIAQSEVEGAKASIDNIKAQLGEQVHVVEALKAATDGDRGASAFATQQLDRYGSLAQHGYGSTERWQQAQSDSSQRSAALAHDLASQAAAQAHLKVLQTQEVQAEAMLRRQQAGLERAAIDLSYTSLYAPVDGPVANRSVQTGNLVQPGQALFSAVPDAVYVVANFKETQLAALDRSQSVDVSIDALPGRRLRGHVDSFQRGTGAAFALLPPENATGNFVKVVQRIPVKIMIDERAEVMRRLSPGMSATVSIAVRPIPRWLRWLAFG